MLKVGGITSCSHIRSLAIIVAAFSAATEAQAACRRRAQQAAAPRSLRGMRAAGTAFRVPRKVVSIKIFM